MKDTSRPPAKIVSDLVKYRNAGTVLDVGAGFGRHAFFMAEQGFQVKAIEPDIEAFKVLKKKQHQFPDVQITRQTLDELSLDETYNIVIAAMVVHFMPNKQSAHSSIKKIQDLTKPGGLNSVSVLLKKKNNNPKPYLFEEGELIKCYEGWNVLHYEEELGLPYKTTDDSPAIQSYCARIIAEKK